MKDYSEYLKKPGMLEWIESEWINKPAIHDFHAKVINDFIKSKRIKGKVLEVGCGTGNIALRITWQIYYTGIDANEDCIKMAISKNANENVFKVADIRDFNYKGDLVFTFGVLKHFGLNEWSTIFQKICSLGEYLIFDIPVAEQTKDDGEEHHHVWMTMEDIKRNIDDNGFEILEINNQFPVEPVFICKRNSK